MTAIQAQASIDAANAAYYEDQARQEFAKGNICWGLYFLDAVEFYAEPSEETARLRIGILLAAIDRLPERRKATP